MPTPDKNTDIIKFDRLTRIDDADTNTNTVDVPFGFIRASLPGWRITFMKHNPGMMAVLKQGEEEMQRAMDEDRDRASLRISPGYSITGLSYVGFAEVNTLTGFQTDLASAA